MADALYAAAVLLSIAVVELVLQQLCRPALSNIVIGSTVAGPGIEGVVVEVEVAILCNRCWWS